MEIEKTVNGTECTMKISGRLDTLTAPQLEKEINTGLNGITDLVMDFSQLEYISSAGLRVLLLASKMMKGKGTFVLKNLCDEIKEIFEVTGFAHIMKIV